MINDHVVSSDSFASKTFSYACNSLQSELKKTITILHKFKVQNPVARTQAERNSVLLCIIRIHVDREELSQNCEPAWIYIYIYALPTSGIESHKVSIG